MCQSAQQQLVMDAGSSRPDGWESTRATRKLRIAVQTLSATNSIWSRVTTSPRDSTSEGPLVDVLSACQQPDRPTIEPVLLHRATFGVLGLFWYVVRPFGWFCCTSHRHLDVTACFSCTASGRDRDYRLFVSLGNKVDSKKVRKSPNADYFELCSDYGWRVARTSTVEFLSRQWSFRLHSPWFRR